jgi:hypothetical protein
LNERTREVILNLVEFYQGLKATELVAMLASHKHEKILETLQVMIDNEEVLEVEYTLPSMPWRVKSFLLPKGTSIQLTKVSVDADNQ